MSRHKRTRRGRFQKPTSRTPNPLFKSGFLSEKEMISCVESLAFGEIGCAILKTLGIRPISLLAERPTTIKTEES